MKKIVYFIGSALLVSASLASCSLDAESYTEKNTQTFPQNEGDIAQMLAGIYSNLNTVNANPQASFLYWSQLASDDCLGGGGPNDKMMQAEDLLCNSGADMTQQFYLDRFTGINRANTALDALSKVSLSDDLAAQAKGETLFLRAFFYYELASMYGPGIPLLTSPTGDNVPGSTPKEMWGQILEDLYTAATTMPAVRKQDGHVDKYCAEAMLGRAWLFYTGMYGNGEDLAALTSDTYNPLTEVALPNGETLTKAQVVELINDCVNNSGYSLVGDYRNLWAYTNKYTREDYTYTKGQNLQWCEDDNAVSPETMFAIKFNKQASWQTTIGYSNGYALHFGFRGDNNLDKVFPFGQGWGAGPVSPALVDDWSVAEPNDMRRDATIQKTSELADYTPGTSDWMQETDFYAKKFSAIACLNNGVMEGGAKYLSNFDIAMYGPDGWSDNSKPDNFQLNAIHDLVLIRFADVLLMQSELTDNADGMNRVRQRAGLPAIGYSLKALQNERRWELACEGTRWNDIRRWHIASDALDKQQGVTIWNDQIKQTNTPQQGGYKARYKATAGYAKIPENQVVLSSGGITQNPGWDNGSDYNGWN